jgi:pimeloyl-ACP methyl ester carboxylesterase
MNSLFFGDSRRRLFGVWHPARPEVARDRAVLLCYPAPQEYNLTHWAFRKLAGLLSRDGLHVFRFDYSCTGDSEGDAEAGNLNDWVDDIRTAGREVRDLSGARTLSLVGMRLGAWLALRACREPGLEVRDLVLWEPVVSGRTYLQQFEDIHELRRLQLLDPLPRVRDELMGFPLPGALRAEIEAIDSTQGGPPAAKRIAVVTSSGDGEIDALLRALGPLAQRRQIDEASLPHGERESALLSNEALTSIAEALR